jgi:hypothetical protein
MTAAHAPNPIRRTVAMLNVDERGAFVDVLDGEAHQHQRPAAQAAFALAAKFEQLAGTLTTTLLAAVERDRLTGFPTVRVVIVDATANDPELCRAAHAACVPLLRRAAESVLGLELVD